MPRVEISKASIGIYSFNHVTQSPIPHYEFDLNTFRDPMGNRTLLDDCKDGRAPRVQEWIKADPRYVAIMDSVTHLVKDHVDHGKSGWLSIAFRDYHGLWKSRAIAELVADELGKSGYNVGVLHA